MLAVALVVIGLLFLIFLTR
jgi:hypothetical protein